MSALTVKLGAVSEQAGPEKAELESLRVAMKVSVHERFVLKQSTHEKKTFCVAVLWLVIAPVPILLTHTNK